MLFAASIIGLILAFSEVRGFSNSAHLCSNGHVCQAVSECCELGCCFALHPAAPAPPPPPTEPATSFQDSALKYYMDWFVAVTSVLAFAFFVLFGLYICVCKRPCEQPEGDYSDHDSAGSCYPPPRYSRCGSIHHSPPPYNEVTSKPDQYPLVITYGDGDKAGSNYLMVHYFRNYVNPPPRSLSATSTAESINSSFLCNATNEANSIVPPPYSGNGGVEEWSVSGAGGATGPRRPSILRSLSSLTDDRTSQSFHPPPPRSLTAPLRIDDGPPTHPPSRLSRNTDLSPDAEGRRSSFRETLISSPAQEDNYPIDLELLDYEISGFSGTRTSAEAGSRPRLGASPPVLSKASSKEQVCDSELESFRRLFSAAKYSDGVCDSPPQPTSPTQGSKNSTIKRPNESSKDRVVKALRGRKTSLYMPLTGTSNKVSLVRQSPTVESRSSWGFRSSRSAPTTPAGAVTAQGMIPGLIALSQKVTSSGFTRSSKLCEESNPLLTECEPQDSALDDSQF